MSWKQTAAGAFGGHVETVDSVCVFSLTGLCWALFTIWFCFKFLYSASAGSTASCLHPPGNPEHTMKPLRRKKGFHGHIRTRRQAWTGY